MKISRKKHLEIFLEKIPPHPNPKVELEQYKTPSKIVADLTWNAYRLNDISDLKIADLACGTGIFAIASLILGAKSVLGVDIDEDSLKIAKKTTDKLIFDKQLTNINSKEILKASINFYNIDLIKYLDEGNVIRKVDGKNVFENIDERNIINQKNDLKVKKGRHGSNDIFKNIGTVFQNPPFGSQLKSKDHPDRKFIELAMDISPVVYSLHMAITEDFLDKYYEIFNGTITHKFYYKFPIPKIYDFHDKETKFIDVIALRVERF